MKNRGTGAETRDLDWHGLYRIVGVAALVAGLLFRRNIAAEVGLFGGQASPVSVGDWFALLQSNRLLGLVYLNVLDIVNYVLVGLMFLALWAALRRARSQMVVATTLALVGIAVYLASNTALSMLALSEQYAAATAEAQRTQLVAAGQALLAIHRFAGPGAHPGAGGYVSLFLVALAGLLTSLVMLRSRLFNRATAIVGIIASALDLAYCLAYAFLPAIDRALLAVALIPAAGLFLMAWHILVGLKLYRLGRSEGKALPKQA